jgi:hypothetical protein
MTTKPKTRKASAKRAAPKAAPKQAAGDHRVAPDETRRLWHLTYPLIASANPAHVTHAFLAMLAYGLPLWA